MEREDYKVLPLAMVGLVQGVFRYFVVSPLVERFERFTEARIPSQESLDALIAQFEAEPPVADIDK